MGDAELSDGPYDTIIALGGLTAVALLAIYEMQTAIAMVAVSALAGYVAIKEGVIRAQATQP